MNSLRITDNCRKHFHYSKNQRKEIWDYSEDQTKAVKNSDVTEVVCKSRNWSSTFECNWFLILLSADLHLASNSISPFQSMHFDANCLKLWDTFVFTLGPINNSTRVTKTLLESRLSNVCCWRSPVIFFIRYSFDNAQLFLSSSNSALQIVVPDFVMFSLWWPVTSFRSFQDLILHLRHK